MLLILFCMLFSCNFIINSHQQSSDVSYPTPTSIPTMVNNYKGPNLSGPEFNSGLGKRLYFDYIYPTTTEIDYYASKGFGLIRLPFDMTRTYPTPYSLLDKLETGYIKTTVDYCLSKGMRVILDPHNYGSIYDNRTGSSRKIGEDIEGTKLFADFWGRMATVFKNYPNVLFCLMNEPYGVSAANWYSGAVPAITAIRTAGATQMILIPGTSWTGAHSWVSSGNAMAWTQFNGDPLKNFVFDFHQYLDRDSSGTNDPCSANAYLRLRTATDWLTVNDFKGHLGEFGWTTDLSCISEAAPFMNFLAANSKVWIGWAWWCAGPWYPASYRFMLDPTSFTAPIIDRPQMTLLLNYL